MKWLVFLLILTSLYVFGLLKTTDVVLNQVQDLNTTYQYIGNNADAIAEGKPVPVQIVNHP